MKQILFFLLAQVFVLSAPAQKKGRIAYIDSLKSIIQKTNDDTAKAMLLAKISFKYSSLQPEEGVRYGTEALELAKKINWEKGIAFARYYRGANYLYLSKFPEAIEDWQLSLNFFEKNKYRSEVAGAMSNIGGVYAFQNKIDKALEYYLKAWDINHKYDPEGEYEIANLANLGALYSSKNEYSKAIEFYMNAVDICMRKNNTDMLTRLYAGLAFVYIEMNDIRLTYAYASKALPMALQENDAQTIGGAYLMQGASVFLMIKQNDKHLLDSLFQGNRESAFLIAKKNLDSAVIHTKEIDDLNNLKETYRYLSELERYKGDYKQALDYQVLFKATSDSMLNSEKNEKVLEASLQNEFEKKEAITKAEQEKKDIRQNLILNSIGLGLVGALIFLLIVYRQRNRISKEKKRSDGLLLNILPEEVAEELKNKGTAEAKLIESATVLFTDFKGFTQFSEKLTPKELVAEIDYCFSAFDAIVQKYEVEKIKTIGDSYMCAGGLPLPNNTHATDVVKAALDIQEFMQKLKIEREATGKLFLEIRIGIHTGPVVAGIVGVKKYSYDIWGDTVNTASRMESSGEAGKINISGTTYELVKDKFKCIYRGKIEAKNKGEVDMYFLDGVLA